MKPQPPWSKARLRNAFDRDFTVNALMYDPCSGVIYDYVGGVLDCERRVLRTVIEPYQSFLADPARMLRGIRLAACAGKLLVAEAPQVAAPACMLRKPTRASDAECSAGLRLPGQTRDAILECSTAIAGVTGVSCCCCCCCCCMYGLCPCTPEWTYMSPTKLGLC